jgi:hypothetical protein
MVVEQRRAFITASLTEEPFNPITSAPGVEIPEGFNEFRLGSPVSAWLDDPRPVFSRIFSGVPVQFPVQELFLNLFIMQENQYEAMIRLQFENATQARGMAAILNIARGFAGADPVSSILFASPPIQSGQNVDIRSAALGEDEITLLLQMFLIY